MKKQTTLMSMIKMDMLRLQRGNVLKIGILLEIAMLILCAFAGGCDFKSVQDVCMSQYMGIVLSIRYVYIGVLISQLFSRDINERVFEMYFSTANPRGRVLASKMSCVLLTEIICISLSSVVLYIYCLTICDMRYILLEFIKMIVLNWIPLIVHAFFVMIIDLLFRSAMLTNLSTICLIMASGLLPYNVGRWIYVSYANLCVFVNYSAKEMVWIMCLTLGCTALLSLVLGWIRIQRLELL